MQNLEVESIPKNWRKIKNAVENELFGQNSSLVNSILLSCEEIFINICSYAYKKKREKFILKLMKLIVK